MSTEFLTGYIPVADAIARLLHPTAEVVIHELDRDRVFHVANPVSGRVPGDTALLKLGTADLAGREDIIGPYEKAGEKGQTVRSVTAVLRDTGGRAVGLMCINLDYSAYEPALDLLEALIRPRQESTRAEILFRNDWRDQIKLEVRSFLMENRIAPDGLDMAGRRTLMARLETRGLFYAKKSIEQVAVILGVSRATAYNDLQVVRKTAGNRGRQI